MTADVIPLHAAPLSSWADYIASEISAELGRRRWAQKDLAAAIGMSGAQVSRVLSGKRTMDVEFVERACRALGLRLLSIADWTPPDEPTEATPTKWEVAGSIPAEGTNRRHLRVAA